MEIFLCKINMIISGARDKRAKSNQQQNTDTSLSATFGWDLLSLVVMHDVTFWRFLAMLALDIMICIYVKRRNRAFA